MKLARAFEPIIERLPGTSPDALFGEAADLLPESMDLDPRFDPVAEIRRAIEEQTSFRWTGYRNGAGDESLADGRWVDGGR